MTFTVIIIYKQNNLQAVIQNVINWIFDKPEQPDLSYWKCPFPAMPKFQL